MYKEPIWPDIVVILDGIGIVLFVAYLLVLGVIL